MANLKKRVKAIVKHTMEDFNNNGYFMKESTNDTIKWLSDDLMNIDDIDDLSTIEISFLTLKRLNCLELVNVEMITKTIENDEKFNS
jgi:hypothetical protein